MKAPLPLCLLLLLGAACCRDKDDVAPHPSIVGIWACTNDSIAIYKNGRLAAGGGNLGGSTGYRSNAELPNYYAAVTPTTWTDSTYTTPFHKAAYTLQGDTLLFPPGMDTGNSSDINNLSVQAAYPPQSIIVELTAAKLHLRAESDKNTADGVYHTTFHRYFYRVK